MLESAEGVHFDAGNVPLYEAIAGLVLPGERVLDLGCGHGALGVVAAAAGAGHVTFSDVHAPSVTLALANAERNGLGPCRGVVGDLLAPVCDERFDLILFNPPQTGGSAELGKLRPDRYGGEDGALYFCRLAESLGDALAPLTGRVVGMRLSRANPEAVDMAFRAAGLEIEVALSITRAFRLEELDVLATGTGAHQLKLRAEGRSSFTGPDEAGVCRLQQELFVARWQAGPHITSPRETPHRS